MLCEAALPAAAAGDVPAAMRRFDHVQGRRRRRRRGRLRRSPAADGKPCLFSSTRSRDSQGTSRRLLNVIAALLLLLLAAAQLLRDQLAVSAAAPIEPR